MGLWQKNVIRQRFAVEKKFLKKPLIARNVRGSAFELIVFVFNRNASLFFCFYFFYIFYLNALETSEDFGFNSF